MAVGCNKKEPAPPATQPEANTPAAKNPGAKAPATAKKAAPEAAKKPDAQKGAAIEHWQVPGKGDMLGFSAQGKLLVATMGVEGVAAISHVVTIDTATGGGSQVDVRQLALERVILLPDGASLLGKPAVGTKEPDAPYSMGTYKRLKLPDCGVTKEFQAPYEAVLAPDGSALVAFNARTSQFDVFSGQDGKMLGNVKGSEGETALIGPGGKYLAIGKFGSPARIVEGATGTVVKSFDDLSSHQPHSYAASGHLVLFKRGGFGNHFVVVDTTFKPVTASTKDTSWTAGRAPVSRDGTLLAVAHGDSKKLAVFKGPDVAALLSLSVHKNPTMPQMERYRAMLFSDDAHTLYVWSPDLGGIGRADLAAKSFSPPGAN